MLENQQWSAKLTPRERQIIQALLTKGDLTAAEVQAAMPEAPSYSAVRAHLRAMEEKGLVTHRQDGPRYLYRARTPRGKARRNVLGEVLAGFFAGSRTALVEALLDPADGKVSERELAELAELIEKARREQKEAD
jgi:predicted transcriptional regulator